MSMLAVAALCVICITALGAMYWRAIRLQKENARLIATAEAASQRVDDLHRAIAHDLRNSLASVLTGSEVLLAVHTSPEAKPILESIQRQANVIAQIVDRLVEDPKHPSTTSSDYRKHSNSEAVREASREGPDERTSANEATQKRTRLRILAIDDRRDVLLPLRVLLTKEGHEFAEAEDGSSGLEKVETFRPEIVLCDIDLQGKVSGLDVARKIRGQSRSNSIYLVAISGNYQALDLENSAQAGFDFHLAKPITAAALRDLIYNRPKNLNSPNREIPQRL